jgi:catechol 2,3-dioxygenase-like lactoylglutathione lyase family enzyme
MKLKLNLLVLRCENIEKSKLFYEKLGLLFQKEQHGNGPEHYSTQLDHTLIELYPLAENRCVENTRLGFSLDRNEIDGFLIRKEIKVTSQYQYNDKKVIVVEDPDRRKIELKEV